MTREEALEKFEKENQDRLELNKEEAWKEIEENQEKILDTIRKGLEELKKALEEKGKQDTVYFQFSILRVDLLEYKYRVLLQAYNAAWYLDKECVSVALSFDYLLEEKKEKWKQLYQDIKIYLGKISKYDIDFKISEQMTAYHRLLAHSLRFLLKEIEEDSIFSKIPKSKLFLIRFGEYRDKSELVFYVDREQKTQKDWEEACEKVKEKEDHLVFSYWYEAELEKGEVRERQLFYIGFEKCKLKDICFEKAAMEGAKFLNCTIKESSFREADLRNANFKGSHFEKVDFENANLAGAVFEEEEIPYLHLTPEQLQKIEIERRRESNALF